MEVGFYGKIGEKSIAMYMASIIEWEDHSYHGWMSCCCLVIKFQTLRGFNKDTLHDFM